MKYILIIIGLLLTGCSSLYELREDQNFSISKGSDTRLIHWVRLSHSELQKKCSELFNVKVPFTQAILGCAQTANNICFVYTGVDTTHQILGHEVRHCYQGNFHK